MTHSSIASVAHGGRVIACYGRRGVFEDESGQPREFVIKGRSLRVVCGDIINGDTGPAENPVVAISHQPRLNVLERVDFRGQREILAANLDQLLIVLAARPVPDFWLADRFLCAAELMGVEAGIIWNKCDLGLAEPVDLDHYRRIGHPTISVSATAGINLHSLEDSLRARITWLAGQSGAGKSSLVNAIADVAGITTGALSKSTGEGRHTTTTAIMYRLPNGGRIIDSPGVREFSPLITDEAAVQHGFRDVLQFAGQCRFANCRHLREPGCNVTTAVASGELPERRYESYKRILRATLQRLKGAKS